MADYPIIADISAYIVRLLREKMCPEPIPSPNNIEVSSPSEQEVDYILGLYLYDLCEEGEVSMPPMMKTGKSRLRRPPRPYTLYYMLFLNGSSQMGLKGQDVQKIIGRAAQVVNDGNVIYPQRLQTWLESAEAPVIISPARPTLDEKVRIWQAINKPYQVGLYYKAAPVFLSSEIVVDAPRVTQASFTLHSIGEEE